MSVQLSNWQAADGGHVNIVMDICKVDQERRTVSGFASLNNLDKQDQIVTADASAEAFAEFRGNIREMHQPIAAGHIVSFSQAPYYDAETNQTYQGIFVEAYVSKGAENTWIKVNDGTLTGFSIGGKAVKSHSEYVPELGKSVLFITKLMLSELSLVDNPANQFANILSIQKSDNGLVLKGMAAEVTGENILWCDTDKFARTSTDETGNCVKCHEPLTNIGWIEVTDSTDVSQELKKFVDEWSVSKVITSEQIKEQLGETTEQNDKFANEENIGDNNEQNTEKSEGGVEDVANEENVAVATDVSEVEAPDVEKAETVEAPVVEEETVEVEKAESVEEVPEENLIEKALQELKTFVEETVTKSAADSAAALQSLTEQLEEVKKSIEPLSSIETSVNEAKETLGSVTSKVENLEKATATKKSGDDDTSEPVQKAFSWSGHFAGVNSITKTN